MMRLGPGPPPPLLLLLLLVLPTCVPHGGNGGSYYYWWEHSWTVQQRPAVYDVEVREVDSSQLGQILRNVPAQQVYVQGGPNGRLHPLRGPDPRPGPGPGPDRQQQGQWYELKRTNGVISGVQGPGGQWYPYRSAPSSSNGQVQAQFVAPSGQVYSLKNIDGQLVLVGPDGRWHVLNNGGAQVGADHRRPAGHEHDVQVSPPADPQLQEPQQGLGTSPNYGDDGPSYDSRPVGEDDRPKGVREAQDCVPSQTTYNGGKSACRYQLLFDENFRTFNLSRWKHDVLMAAEPDFEFVVYDGDPDNSYLSGNGLLVIKPTVLEDSYKPGFTMNGTLTLNGCTSPRRDQCTRTAHTYRILPAIRSARITTKDSFSFRYGIVEARILIPEGDWIYPAFTLEPATQTYGRWYASGQIRMPSALGNKWLSEVRDGPRVGLQLLRAGVAFGLNPRDDIIPTTMDVYKRAEKGSNWRIKHFRVYRLKWTPDYMEFSLDGKTMGKIEPPRGGFVSLTENPDSHPWKEGTHMAPFDQEFFLSLAVGVGGVNRFRDNSSNGEYHEHPKPWKNSSPKALLDFWKSRDFWLPTWVHPAMEVDYVRVWAL